LLGSNLFTGPCRLAQFLVANPKKIYNALISLNKKIIFAIEVDNCQPTCNLSGRRGNGAAEL
jgi:hypothetical protein